MKVIIVARTKMRDSACIGALGLDDNRSMRLLDTDGANPSLDSEYRIGQIWDIEAKPRVDITPPHIEDILVTHREYVGEQSDLRRFLEMRVPSWKGGPEQLFEGLLKFTETGSGYITKSGHLPSGSTGFWTPDRPLTVFLVNHSVRYEYTRSYVALSAKYVGLSPYIHVIEAGTLVRISLARWWAPANRPPACCVQISGWYL